MTVPPLLRSALVTAAILPLGVQQPARFRTGVDLVPIYATVIGKDLRLVPGLSREDFELLDNGASQPIAFFTDAVPPISIVILLDSSGSMVDHWKFITNAAEHFVMKLLPSDRALIGRFSYEILFAPPHFTNDRAALLNALPDSVRASGPSPVWTAIDRSVDLVLHEPGRRVVLIFSDGHDEPMRGQVRTDVAHVLRRAHVDGVMLYSFGVLVAEEPGQQLAVDSAHRHRAKLLLPDPTLRQLAEASGGAYFQIDWGSNLNLMFERVADELHHQYVLGFTPRALDGKMHNIVVKVRRPGVTVQARKTYLAAPDK